jgi:peptidoglycan/LPS O-acetylase OafA/YrhL
LSNRFISLDGLRGVAAIIVVIFHFMSAFTPEFVPDQSKSPPWWADSPLAVLFNGTFAVPVFFVLSGFVLTHSSVKAQSNLSLDMVLRYFRLVIPASMSVLLAWLLLKMIPNAASELRALIPGPWLSYTHQDQIPSFYFAAKDGVYGAFVHGYSRFNNVLWTMQTELIGSFCIYIFFRFVRMNQLTWLIIVTLILILTQLPTGYIAFSLGSALYLIHRDGFTLNPRSAGGIFLVGLVIGSWSTGFAQRQGLPALPSLFEPGHKSSIWYPLAALFVVAGTLHSPILKTLFSSKLTQFLGVISFPIYLLHVPLIYTVIARAALDLDLTRGVGLVFLAAASLMLTMILSLFFERFVDQPVMSVIRRVRKLVS